MDYNSPPKPETSAAPSAEGNSSQAMPPYPLQEAYHENSAYFKHSGPGIASFVIALLTFACYVLMFVYVGSQAASVIDENNKLIAESAEMIMYVGISVLLLAAMNVIGAVIGIIGLTLRSRRKVFAIIGTVINAVILLVFMLLISSVLVNAGAV